MTKPCVLCSPLGSRQRICCTVPAWRSTRGTTSWSGITTHTFRLHSCICMPNRQPLVLRKQQRESGFVMPQFVQYRLQGNVLSKTLCDLSISSCKA